MRDCRHRGKIGRADYVTLRSFDRESAVPDDREEQERPISAQDDNAFFVPCRGGSCKTKKSRRDAGVTEWQRHHELVRDLGRSCQSYSWRPKLSGDQGEDAAGAARAANDFERGRD
jgi:hypothetical protein